MPGRNKRTRTAASASEAEPAFEPFITKLMVAQRLNINFRMVSRLMFRGILRFYKLGPWVRFKWTEVEQDIREHCQVILEPEEPGGPENRKSDASSAAVLVQGLSARSPKALAGRSPVAGTRIVKRQPRETRRRRGLARNK